MKKNLLILIISFILFPVIVNADETCANESPLDWCYGSSCLTSLQRTYNTWSTTGNTGKACIKVIAQRKGNSKSYLSGKNPNTDYRCASGNTPTKSLVASSLPDQQTDVSECSNNICYVPELWAVDCGDSNTSNSNETTNSDNSSNSASSGIVNNNSNSNGTNSGNVQTNSQGQITGTTDVSDTGVETYFIVLIVMVILSYVILFVSKNRNIFKSI